MKGKATLQLSKLPFFKVADAKFKVDFHFINLTSNFLVHIHVYFSFSLNIFTIDLSTFCVIFYTLQVSAGFKNWDYANKTWHLHGIYHFHLKEYFCINCGAASLTFNQIVGAFGEFC